MTPIVWICVDSIDPPALAPFWAAALGYAVQEPKPDSTYLYLEGPGAGLPAIYFQKVSERKVVKNSLHLDLRTPEAAELIDQLERLGAMRVGDPQSGKTCAWWLSRAGGPEGFLFLWARDTLYLW